MTGMFPLVCAINAKIRTHDLHGLEIPTLLPYCLLSNFPLIYIKKYSELCRHKATLLDKSKTSDTK